MATLRDSPNLNTLIEERKEYFSGLRNQRRKELVLKRQKVRMEEEQSELSFDKFEEDLLQSDNPVEYLNNNSQMINILINNLNSMDKSQQISSLKIIGTISSLQIEECSIAIQSSFSFLVLKLTSNDEFELSTVADAISSLCYSSNKCKQIFLALDVVKLTINCITEKKNLLIVTLASLVRLLATCAISNQSIIVTILKSPIVNTLMMNLTQTNNSNYISSVLLLFSLLSSNPLFASVCIVNTQFLHYLAVIITTQHKDKLLSPTLTIIGNLFTISTYSQLVPFLTSSVINGLIQIVQRDTLLTGDAVLVLGNLVSVTNFNVVRQVVESGTLPLLFKLLDNAIDEQLVKSVLFTISNIMATENNGIKPYINCCLELGLLQYLFDFMKVFDSQDFYSFSAEILFFLLGAVPDLSQRIERINGFGILNDISICSEQIKYFTEKLSWLNNGN